MKRLKRKVQRNIFTFYNIALILSALLMLAYMLQPSIKFEKLAPPSECADGAAEVYLLNNQFIGNAVIINVTSPSCIIAVAKIHLGIPSDITVDLNNIHGTGAFSDMYIRQKKKAVDLEIDYADLSETPSNYEGSIVIPFSASQPGEYDLFAKEKMRFLTDDGKRINMVFHIPKLRLQMFNFSFHVQPSLTAGTKNKVPVGSFGDTVLNTTIAGSFIFNLTVSDPSASNNLQISTTTQQPIYTWKEAFDSYLHPENRHACNAGMTNTFIILDYSNNKISNSIEVELTKPKLSDIYPIIDRYFNSIGTEQEDPTLIPRAYYMVGSYFNCP